MIIRYKAIKFSKSASFSTILAGFLHFCPAFLSFFNFVAKSHLVFEYPPVFFWQTVFLNVVSGWFSDTPNPHGIGWGSKNNGYSIQRKGYLWKDFFKKVFAAYFIQFLHKLYMEEKKCKTVIFLGTHTV